MKNSVHQFGLLTLIICKLSFALAFMILAFIFHKMQSFQKLSRDLRVEWWCELAVCFILRQSSFKFGLFILQRLYMTNVDSLLLIFYHIFYRCDRSYNTIFFFYHSKIKFTSLRRPVISPVWYLFNGRSLYHHISGEVMFRYLKRYQVTSLLKLP